MHGYEWTSPRKTVFYHMDRSDSAARKRLFLAVTKGEVRARLTNGRVLGLAYAKCFREILVAESGLSKKQF